MLRSDAAFVLSQTDLVSLNLKHAPAIARKTLDYLRAGSDSKWADEPLHPAPVLPEIIDWVFFVTLMNFSFVFRVSRYQIDRS
jgi:hypothetical protein